MSKFEGYRRCSICDYCELSAFDDASPLYFRREGNHKRAKKFKYIKEEDAYWCIDCYDAIKDTTNTQDEITTEPLKGPFILTPMNENRVRVTNPKGAPRKKTITLPGVRGVNEGPKVDPATHIANPIKETPVAPTSSDLDATQDGGDPLDWEWYNAEEETDKVE